MTTKLQINGLLLLDKPSGITSNRALQIVKRAYQAKKAGHTGTLDPLATGMLPIVLGEATKFAHYQLTADKRYQVTMALGQTTSTGDVEGEVINERQIGVYNKQQIKSVIEQFIGEIEQIPPMYSALKYQGQPLYKLARAGKQVELQPRLVKIYSIELLSVDPGSISLEVHCSKGTYIRSLVGDMGEVLGCGAHVTALRRLSTASFETATMHTLESIKAADSEQLASKLRSVDSLLTDYPQLHLQPEQSEAFCCGRTVNLEAEQSDGLVRVYNFENHLLGLGEIIARVLHPRRLMSRQ